jgi:hypothetical protein
MSRVIQKYRVSFDSEQGNTFIVTKPDGTTFEFIQSDAGLYYLDTSNHGVALVTTVAQNKSKYTNADYLKAVTARNLQIKIGRPSTKDFMRIVTDNLLPNCPITKADILAAEDIFGPDLGTLKGKSTRAKPHKVRPILVSIPQQILQRYRSVTICVDLMFVNKVAFLVTISRNIHFGTVYSLLLL